MQKVKDRANKPVHTVVQYNYTMEQSREHLYKTARSARSCSFEKLFNECENRIQAIFLFLSMLELVQMKYLSLITGEGRNNFLVEFNQEREEDPIQSFSF
jgi:segregation and condensation protein A